MNIGKIIYKLRKERHLTQEQLANAVGVTVPAVSKWESGSSYPDITLLSPIARMLGTNVDFLLSYQMEMAKSEVEELMRGIKEECENAGFRKGMTKAFNLLKEYPNSEYLKLEVAMSVVSYTYTIESDYTEEEYQEIYKLSTRLLEEVINTDNKDINTAAKFTLATRYMTEGNYEKAEELLLSFSNIEYSSKHIMPSLYFIKGDYNKSLSLAEQNLLQDLQNLRNDLMTIFYSTVKQNNYDKALDLAKHFNNLSESFGNHMPSGAELFIYVYLKMNDLDNALFWFEKYIDDIIDLDMDYSKSIFFEHISDDIVIKSIGVQTDIKTGLYKGILLNPYYDIIRNKKEYIKGVEKLKLFIESLNQ